MPCQTGMPRGHLIGKTGVMSEVAEGDWSGPGGDIRIDLPAAPHRPLAPV